ncbi:MAG: leucyl aminopeptidase family protein [Deltaproteobacteria bacterium]|nr:leucyl aminopeptidase family protein [Deltaproteobacteria bacterium]
MALNVLLETTLAPLHDTDTLFLIGRADDLLQERVRAVLPSELSPSAWDAMVRGARAGDHGAAASTWLDARPSKVGAGVLPEACSRHNSPSRAWAIPAMVKAAGQPGSLGLLFVLGKDEHLTATVAAAARALPSFSARSRERDNTVHVAFWGESGLITDLDAARQLMEAVRFAAHMVDMPPNRLHTQVLIETSRKLAGRLPGVSIQVIEGDEVRQAGLGGLWGVGKGSSQPPALVVLDWAPEGAARHVAWVGKGIVYDTGGLSIKSRTGMVGMKTDMAGAAAVLAAFVAAVNLQVPQRLTAVLAIAENAVGPLSARPDDVLTLYSGRTVEVNNTDAEGRLVLADGAAWAIKNRAPDQIVDMATLTGAQLIATGRQHAAIYCSDEALEQRAVQVGKEVGELVHPVPFAPELFRKEFGSPVADMTNSVKDRNNAQSSCAGQFILNHLGDWTGPWLHVDMAGPAEAHGRGTGWGPALLLGLLAGEPTA